MNRRRVQPLVLVQLRNKEQLTNGRGPCNPKRFTQERVSWIA